MKKTLKKMVTNNKVNVLGKHVVLSNCTDDSIIQSQEELETAITDLEGAFKQIELVLKRTSPQTRVMLLDMIINATIDITELPKWVGMSILTTSLFRMNNPIKSSDTTKEGQNIKSYIN